MINYQIQYIKHMFYAQVFVTCAKITNKINHISVSAAGLLIRFSDQLNLSTRGHIALAEKHLDQADLYDELLSHKK